MSRFDPAIEYTFGQLLDGTAAVKDRNEAHDYFWDLVDYYIKRYGKTQREAVAVASQNIGYYSGYFDITTAERVRELFGVKHPGG